MRNREVQIFKSAIHTLSGPQSPTVTGKKLKKKAVMPNYLLKRKCALFRIQGN